jgi:hypothetical protein
LTDSYGWALTIDEATLNFQAIASLLILSTSASACGATVVDLDSTVIEASSEPGVLAIVHERIERLAVDDERLYWFGSRLPQGRDYRQVSLRSCQKRNCASTLVTYATTNSIYYSPYYDFSLNESRIYWRGESGLQSCSIAGCNGVPRAEAATINNEELELRQLIAPAVSRSANREFAVATDDTFIYWTNSVLAGSIARCPLTDCLGNAEVIISPLRAPQYLIIDNRRLYYEYETEPYDYVISSCTLPACTDSEIAPARLDAPLALALDDSYLYVATTTQNVSPNTKEETIARIRRLTKPGSEQP